MTIPDHIRQYLAARLRRPDELLDSGRYYVKDGDLFIRYCDEHGKPYLISNNSKNNGDGYLLRRPFPTIPQKFKCPHQGGNRIYISPLMPAGYLSDTSKPAVFVEGPIKVDALYQDIPEGYCFIGLTGTWSIRDRRGEDGVWLEENEDNKRLIPEFKAIPMRGRKAIVLYDSDIIENQSVSDAAAAVGLAARQRGARPYRCQLPTEANGDKNGADDFLQRYGAEALIELLQASEIEGWDLPASLLDHKGELKKSYTPREESQVIKCIAGLTDYHHADSLIRGLYRRLHMTRNELVMRVGDEREGISERGLFFDPAELQAQSIDHLWVVPGMLLRGEVIIVSGLSGTGKTLMAYAMGSAARRGGDFLGMRLPKLRVCILQLEEGSSSFASRMDAFGFTGDGIGVEWNAIRSFNPLKPSHMEMLKQQVLPNYDFFILDSIREMSSGSGLNESLPEYSQQLVRPLVKVFRGTDKSMLIIDHNSKGSNEIAGGDDKRAAVWGVFNMRKLNEHNEGNVSISSHQAHGGKSRDSDAIHYELQWEKISPEDRKPGQDLYTWKLISDLRPDCIDLTLLERCLALLESQPEPMTLRDIGDRLGLLPEPNGKVNDKLRKLASRSPALRRYRNGEVRPATYFMPLDERNPAITKNIIQLIDRCIEVEPCCNTKGSNGSLLVPNQPSGTQSTKVDGSTSSPLEPPADPQNPVHDSQVPDMPSGLLGELKNPQPDWPSMTVDGQNGWLLLPGQSLQTENVTLCTHTGNAQQFASNRVAYINPEEEPF